MLSLIVERGVSRESYVQVIINTFVLALPPQSHTAQAVLTPSLLPRQPGTGAGLAASTRASSP